jgi:plasmid replication initiation protein
MDESEAKQVVPWRPSKKMVVQHNALAEAKYRLSLRAQKLLIRLLTELDQRKDDFTDITLFLRDFAKLASGDPGDVLYAEFIDTAKQFMGKFVSITQSPVPGEKLPRSLTCHWISSIEKNPNLRSITFSFDPKLRPYLLGLSRNYFAYYTLHAFNLDSVYSIRLYQWAKSRQYLRRPQQVLVEDLRHYLGTTETDSEGMVTKESLKRYNDFKKVALRPAVREINKKTDIFITFQEIKRPGTKIICAIIFGLAIKEGAEAVHIEPEFRAQSELPLENAELEETTDEAAKLVDYVRKTYQFNNEQINKLHGYIAKNGIQYVMDKIAVTESQPRDNMARFLLAALRDDYKMAVKYVPPKKVKPKPQALPKPEISEEERRLTLEEFRNWRFQFASNPDLATFPTNLSIRSGHLENEAAKLQD